MFTVGHCTCNKRRVEKRRRDGRRGTGKEKDGTERQKRWKRRRGVFVYGKMDEWLEGGGRVGYVCMQELSTKAATKEGKKKCKMGEMLDD